MKPITNIFFLLGCFLITNISYGQSQAELNQQAYANYLKKDKELNLVYNKILKEYQSDSLFIKNFKNAQRIWIQLRDAEMKAKFPTREEGYYGSIYSYCWNSYLTELTEERIKKINEWLIGIEEGDICAGTVKLK